MIPLSRQETNANFNPLLHVIVNEKAKNEEALSDTVFEKHEVL